MHAFTSRILRPSSKLPARLIAGRRYRPHLRQFHRSAIAWREPRNPSDPQDAEFERTQDAPEIALPEANEEVTPEDSLKALEEKVYNARRDVGRLRAQLRAARSGGGLPPETEPRVSIPEWFSQNNVTLKEENIPEDEGLYSYCSIAIMDKGSEIQHPGPRLAVPTKYLSDIFGALGVDHNAQLLSQSQAKLFASLKHGVGAEDQPPEPETGPASNLDKEVSQPDQPLHFSIYSEIYATIAASLSCSRGGSPNTFAAQKSNLVLQCPIDGGIRYLDAVVGNIAAKLGADVIQLDPQDLAEIGGDYIGEGVVPSFQSIRSLGYDTYRPELEEEDEEELAEEDSAFEQAVDPVSQAQGPRKVEIASIKAIPLTNLPLNFPKFVKDLQSALGGAGSQRGMISMPLGNALSGAQSFIPAQDVTPQSDSGRLAMLLEAIIDAANAKANSSNLRSNSEDLASDLNENAKTGYREVEEVDLSTILAGGPESPIKVAVNVDLNQLARSGNHSSPPSRKTIILVRDFKEMAASQHGDAIIGRLTQIVSNRRMRGEQITIVGTTSSAELVPELSRAAIKGLQYEREDSFFRTIFAPPGQIHDPQEKGTTNDETSIMDEVEDVDDTWKKQDRERVLEINLRHIRDMIRRIGIQDVDTAFSGRVFKLPFSSPDAAMLENRFLTHDEIHRIAITAIGLQLATLDDVKLQPLHVMLATSLLRYSDDVKGNWAATQRELEREANDESTDTDLPKAKREAEKRIETIRATCNTHEKRLLNGVVNSHGLKTTFEEVHAPAETIEALKSLTSLSLLRPEAFKYGVLATDKIPGLLLYGPPGTGKTLLAKAVAKESGATVLEVSGSEVNDMYVGEGEKNVKAIFTLARKLTPCVVFIDEADAIFGSRSGPGNRASHREIINQFLREWDGMNDQSVFIMVATNRPFDLDDAVLRRLPRRLLVDLPVEQDREAILKIHLRDEALDSSISLAKLASQTPFYSGSDLKNLSVAAALACVREENETAAQAKTDGEGLYQYPEKRTLMQRHFDKATEEISASISEDMASLGAIRKFDEQYGDRKGRRKKRGWGFATATGGEKGKEETARVRT